MQTSREVIRNAIEFSSPDRLPINYEGPNGSDIYWVGWNQIGTGDKSKRFTYDEWHCGWRRTEQANMGQITEHPLTDWSLLEGFAWPNPNDPALYEGMKERVAKRGDKYVLTSIFMLLFERLHGLRGFENLLADLYWERDKVEYLADRIVAYDLAVIDNIKALCPSEIDGFSFTDDWGTETALMINPTLWREVFMPRYKQIFDRCHAHGWHVWMHSCGRVNDIIEPLIEIGCNVLNLQQPRALGIEEIGKRFAGRICFETTCDIQHTLPFASDDEVEAEAKLLTAHWGTDCGGLILSDYGDHRAIGSPLGRNAFMYKMFEKHSRWRV